MSDREIYRHSPIIEAAVNFSVTPAEGWDEGKLRELRRTLGTQFPHVEDLHEGKVKILVHKDEFPPGAQEPVKLPWNGLRFYSEDRTRAAVLRKDSFTYSMLHPYERWETLREQARQLWSVYRTAMDGAAVTRCAIRYINQFNLPQSTVNLEEYFALRPTLPEVGELKNVAGMFMQLQFPQEDLGALLLVNQGTTESEALSILLDLDLATQPGAQPDTEDERWELLERFHKRLHKVFESLITEHARDLIR